MAQKSEVAKAFKTLTWQEKYHLLADYTVYVNARIDDWNEGRPVNLKSFAAYLSIERGYSDEVIEQFRR